jgi:hypothetical protein
MRVPIWCLSDMYKCGVCRTCTSRTCTEFVVRFAIPDPHLDVGACDSDWHVRSRHLEATES